jgi:hypothetical protein
VVSDQILAPASDPSAISGGQTAEIGASEGSDPCVNQEPSKWRSPPSPGIHSAPAMHDCSSVSCFFAEGSCGLVRVAERGAEI